VNNMHEIILENDHFKLILQEDCRAKSLIYKPLNEECLLENKNLTLFSITEKRPYNNEIKLAYPNKRMTFQGNRLRMENGKLIAGFELIPFEAVVDVKITPHYIAFELEEFWVGPKDFGHLAMDKPPVEEFRVLQLPIKRRENFGEWLNVCWDEKVAVNVLGTSQYPRIDSERLEEGYILSADTVRDVKLKGCGAALIVSSKEELFDCIEAVEEDYDLPKGVKSRRSEYLNSSIYWTEDVTPLTVDEHIAYAKKFGFKMMLIFYRSLFKHGDRFYLYCGDYDYREEFPRGAEDVREMLQKIKAAGIIPGMHFLHTHIGIKSRYFTPVADHRLHLVQHYTLAKALGTEDTTIYVEENPQNAVQHEPCRILKFGGELIKYESVSTEWPYCFIGCERGYNGTYVREHELGLIGGIVDVCEYGARSVYLDQNSSLQEEVADKLAAAYNAGFEFVYFDGSEGTNAPFEFHIPNAQYRVYKKLKKEPLFCEGAAKSHFSWHMITGGNAFDVFLPEEFKQKIAEFPVQEAIRMEADFTRVNFGWWNLMGNKQPDMFEYGTSLAAAWDCPVTVQVKPVWMGQYPRMEDNMEVFRRWEDVRAKKWLTKKQKEMLKNTSEEHILLVNEVGKYELVPYKRIEKAAGGSALVSAFIFEREEKTYVVCWHTEDKGRLALPLNIEDFVYEEALGGECISVKEATLQGLERVSVIPLEGRRYFSSSLPKEQVIRAFEKAVLL